MKRKPKSTHSTQSPIQEGDFQQLFELLRKKPNPFREYIERVCCLRMFILGYAAEDKLSMERLYEIIDELGQEDIYGKFRLPEEFEVARNILLRVKKKPDLDRVLDEARSIV